MYKPITLSTPSSCRHDAVQVVVGAALDEGDRFRAVVQLRYREILLSSLVYFHNGNSSEISFTLLLGAR